jgi:hypothetical protein
LVTIILALCIPVTAIVTGFLTFKAVQLGLRWQIETKQQQEPTMTVNPIAPIIEAKQEKEMIQQEKETTSILQEWLNGEESR